MTTQAKSALDHDLILAARQGLLPVSERGWLGGFGNMLRKEMGQWWGTKLWWIQTLIWVLIINGITTIVMMSEPLLANEIYQEVIQTFLPILTVVAFGAIATVQGAIVGEVELGTAAWVISKPASRSAFILAKAIAYSFGFLVTGILIPSVVFIVEVQLLLGASIPLQSFLGSVALMGLNLLFYLMLTLMLGTLLKNRGPIVGIGIAFIMAGLLLKGIIPMVVMVLTPYPLADIASALTLGTPLPEIWFIPVVAVSVWVALMLGVALWRFGREEF
jgi:ABC-2 type transport system permease protein